MTEVKDTRTIRLDGLSPEVARLVANALAAEVERHRKLVEHYRYLIREAEMGDFGHAILAAREDKFAEAKAVQRELEVAAARVRWDVAMEFGKGQA